MCMYNELMWLKLRFRIIRNIIIAYVWVWIKERVTQCKVIFFSASFDHRFIRFYSQTLQTMNEQKYIVFIEKYQRFNLK